MPSLHRVVPCWELSLGYMHYSERYRLFTMRRKHVLRGRHHHAKRVSCEQRFALELRRHQRLRMQCEFLATRFDDMPSLHSVMPFWDLPICHMHCSERYSLFAMR